MKKIKGYYLEHKDSIKNATIGGLVAGVTVACILLNATDKIIEANNLQPYFYGKES